MGNAGHCCSGAQALSEGQRGSATDEGLGASVDAQPKLSWRSAACHAEKLEDWAGSQQQADTFRSSALAAAAEKSLLATVPEQYVSYMDGSTYKGQLLTGKRHGHGLLQAKSGHYDGQWRDNLQHGRGQQAWSDGRAYVGEFCNGKFEGVGKMTWRGDRGVMTYEGEYKDDLKHGTGKFVWADGRSYEGQWLSGKRHGRGLYSSEAGEARAGFWMDDKWSHWEDACEGQPAT